MFRSFCVLADEAEKLTIMFYLLGQMELGLLLELDCGIGRWFPDMTQGVDHFIRYLRFTMMSLFDFEEALEFVEYFYMVGAAYTTLLSPCHSYGDHRGLLFVIFMFFIIFFKCTGLYAKAT